MAARTNTARSTKTAKAAEPELKATVVGAPVAETAQSSVWDRLNEAMQAVQAEYGIMSWKRYVCSLVASLCASFGVGYIGGSLTMYLFTGSLLLTGSAFLSYALAVIGFALTIVISTKLGKAVFAYIGFGHIDLHYAVAKGAVIGAGRWVKNLFVSSKPELSHA